MRSPVESAAPPYDEGLPRLIALTTALLLIAGSVSWVGFRTGDQMWLRAFFNYPGALFFVACAALQTWLSYRCWRQFSAGDLLRPAWFLIGLSGLAQCGSSVVSDIFGLESGLNPLWWSSLPGRDSLTQRAHSLGALSCPLHMAFLAAGLYHVLKAYRTHGIRGRLTGFDILLQAVVVAYTVYFLATVVFAAGHGGRSLELVSIVSWASDPLLCILLFQAILIRRSTASMGLGLVSRCWLSFTAAIFLTSVGDIGLWAWSKGYLAHGFEALSWHVWFLPSAAHAMGPAYQLQAMLRAKAGDIPDVCRDEVLQ